MQKQFIWHGAIQDFWKKNQLEIIIFVVFYLCLF